MPIIQKLALLPLSQRFIRILILPLLIVQLQGYSQSSSEATSYEKDILKQREEKNEELKQEKSPLTDEDKPDFKGLNYYPPDINYKVKATLTRFDNPFHFKMKTTTDRLPEYSLYGKIEFTLQGRQYSLNVYQNIDLLKKPGFEKYLFIPFNDLTNGKSTYGGGRFLDGEIPEGDEFVIDFNLAYNPYCAYNHKYSCPIPPEENSLETEILAGEKKWHD